MDEPARQRARELANMPEFAHAQRQRKKVEALFAELKNQIGLRRLRLRRLKFVREQFFLAGGAKYQALGAIPQPTHNTGSACYHLANGSKQKFHWGTHAAERFPAHVLFQQTHALAQAYSESGVEI
jgi:Transposase DDE domain